jgi:hypothetical protein
MRSRIDKELTQKIIFQDAQLHNEPSAEQCGQFAKAGIHQTY